MLSNRKKKKIRGAKSENHAFIRSINNSLFPLLLRYLNALLEQLTLPIAASCLRTLSNRTVEFPWWYM